MASSGRTSSRSARVVAGTTSLRPMFLALASRPPGAGAPGRGLASRRPSPGRRPGRSRPGTQQGPSDGPQSKVANRNDAVPLPGTVVRGGLATPPATGLPNQRGRVSNRDFPAPYRPDPRWQARSGGDPLGRGDRLPPRPRSAADGYTKASSMGGRGRGVDELDGYGRSPGGHSNGKGRGGQHAQGRGSRGGARDSDERPGRGKDAPRGSGRGDNGYRSRRGAPDPGSGGDRRDG